MPRFLALVEYPKLYLQSTLRMLLELVFIMLSHPFGSLFFKLKGHGGELGTCSFVVLCLTRLCEGAKLGKEVGTGLTCQRYGGVIGSNTVVFTRARAGDMRAYLSAAKSVVNVKVTKDLLCCICDDGGRDKIPLVVTDLSGGETLLTVFF